MIGFFLIVLKCVCRNNGENADGRRADNYAINMNNKNSHRA